ncbi:MAG: hypothetical protein ACO23H_03155 [Alphaproteobacteria bacterium]
MAGNGQQYQASANINVSVFVKLSGDNTVETAGAGDQAIGVMHESAWDTPIPNANDTIAVPQYQSKRVYQDTESCEVIVGSGGLAAGDFVKPDANGHGVAATTGEIYSAVCTTGNTAGARAKVLVKSGSVA